MFMLAETVNEMNELWCFVFINKFQNDLDDMVSGQIIAV